MGETKHTRWPIRAILVGSLAVVLGGCGGGDEERQPVYPVRGRILVKGKPAERALVVLHPLDNPGLEGIRPNGQAGPDGAFTLSTYDAEDGAPSGRYAVTVYWPKASGAPGIGADLGPDLLKGRYSNPQASSLKVEVREGANELEPLRLD